MPHSMITNSSIFPVSYNIQNSVQIKKLVQVTFLEGYVALRDIHIRDHGLFSSFDFWFSIHCPHNTCKDNSWLMHSANLITRHTSWKLLARPRLILTTPSSLPNLPSRFDKVTPGYNCCISSVMPNMAAAPPGLHMHPVRNEIFLVEAAYSMNEFGIISPEGYGNFSEWLTEERGKYIRQGITMR